MYAYIPRQSFDLRLLQAGKLQELILTQVDFGYQKITVSAIRNRLYCKQHEKKVYCLKNSVKIKSQSCDLRL